MSENDGERITSIEGGQPRLLRSSDVVEMLGGQDVLGDDFWWINEVLKDGRLPAQNIWYDVELLRKVSFSDGAIPVEELQKQLTDLQAATETYYQQSVQAELDELNRFLLSRPNLFITDEVSNISPQHVLSHQDQQGRVTLFAHYSDETQAPLDRGNVYIDTTQLTAVEQQAVRNYQRLYES